MLIGVVLFSSYFVNFGGWIIYEDMYKNMYWTRDGTGDHFEWNQHTDIGPSTLPCGTHHKDKGT